MKNIAIGMFCAVFVLPAMVFPLYVCGAPAQEGGVTFRDVEGKEWILLEVKSITSVGSAGETVSMDRKKLEDDNMGGAFTLSFQEGRLSGMGAPNRYFAPYTTGGNRTLSIENIASTQMMAFKEPEGLRESEYFAYLSKVTRWDIREGKLELYSSNSNGTGAILLFTRR